MTTLEELKQEPVFFFTATPIAPGGQGSSMRVYTNLRAYLDLGFRIELVHFPNEDNQNTPLLLPEGEIHLTQVQRNLNGMNRYVKKLAMRLGWPQSFILNAIFPGRQQLVDAVRTRFQEHPQALFHFEYDDFASSITAFPGMRSVWSNHDLFSQRVKLIWQSRDERRPPDRSEAERQRIVGRVRQAEDLIARRASLILNIAVHEHAEFLRRGYRNAVLFPMSWPDEALVRRARAWKEDGKLRLLHLGSVNGLMGYESLSYLIGEVFPRLKPEALDGLELWVVGTVADSFYCNRILGIAKPYPQIRFLGFVEDLREMYAQVDLQVIGGTKASGLRTRIIESMVYGVPVLSTAEMAEGLTGLVDGENILLAADVQDYAEKLSRLVNTPFDFDQLARSARETYDRVYSRSVAAEVLAEALTKFS